VTTMWPNSDVQQTFTYCDKFNCITFQLERSRFLNTSSPTFRRLRPLASLVPFGTVWYTWALYDVDFKTFRVYISRRMAVLGANFPPRLKTTLKLWYIFVICDLLALKWQDWLPLLWNPVYHIWMFCDFLFLS